MGRISKTNFILPAIFLLAISCQPSQPSNPDSGIEGQVRGEDKTFQVEVADTQEERTRGLMHREVLPEDQGMLFVFPEEGIYSFWMKDTLIPLDIIWIDKVGKVVYMQENALPGKGLFPPSYTPQAEALYVLEIGAGQAKKAGWGIGTMLEISLENSEN